MEPDITKDLRDIVQKHTVRYQVSPHREMFRGKQVVVGFDLELYGTHSHGETTVSPGCGRCLETYTDLRRVAEWILPKEERPSEYDIAGFDRSLHASPGGPFEVVLPIRIQHRHGTFDPVDDCEERCLKEMQAKLAELGVTGRRGVRSGD